MFEMVSVRASVLISSACCMQEFQSGCSGTEQACKYVPISWPLDLASFCLFCSDLKIKGLRKSNALQDFSLQDGCNPLLLSTGRLDWHHKYKPFFFGARRG